MDALRGANKSYRIAIANMAQKQMLHLNNCGLLWLAGMAEGAINIISGKEPPAGYFVAGKAEHWREVMSALQSLGSDAPAKAESGESSRFVWMLDISQDGALNGIQELEQKCGARGWGKTKVIVLSKVGANPRLSPWDAKVASFIRTDKYDRRSAILDLPKAVQALVGHPAVVLSGNPEQFIELSTGTPEIEVIHKGDKISLKVTPPLRVSTVDPEMYYYEADEKREAEALRFAPSLNLHLYSEAERDAVIDIAAAIAVVVVSYTMLQQAGEQFAAKQWHTLIVDEAQAIKNATTKRSQSVFDLNADFRLALSGTPVENRLAELWSIMRFLNPSLLGSLTRFNERFAIPIESDKDREALDKAGIEYQYLDVATPAAERTKRVAAFQSEKSDLFVISLKAGGFGLNLTAADYVVITDP